MKKQIQFLILFIFLGFINAQDVEEVVVTSSLTDQTQIDNPVHVIKKDELVNDASVSLGEQLDNLLGVANADFGAAVGQPIIRGMSGSRVKVLSNGMVVRDVSSLGPDHPNNIDLSNAEQVEVVRGPSSLLYSNGTIGGIINVVDNTIAKTNFTETSGNFSHELQEANDGELTTFNLQTNQSGLNISFGLSEADFGSYEIPGGSIVHDEEHEEEGHEEGDMTVLANSDYETSNARFGVSSVGDWGHIGFSLVSRDGTNGIPYHGDGGHGGHDDHGDEDGDEDHEEEGHDDHEGERIFADNTSDIFTLEGSYNLNGELVKKMDFFIRTSDYSLTEQHAEEEHHEDEHHDEDEHDEDEHDEHGHEEDLQLLKTKQRNLE